MTVIVGKTQIHLGIETLIGLIVFACSTTWAISAYKNSQDAKLDKILAWQSFKAVKDSVLIIRVDTLAIRQIAIRLHQKGDDVEIAYLKEAVRGFRAVHYYQEKRVAGRLEFNKVNRPK